MEYDLTRPQSGRILDYWLGGKHNFEVDRQMADRVAQQFPALPEMTKDARCLSGRAVRWFYERGVRVFFDFGSSLPTCQNTHQTAQALDPETKVVYSDIDPVVAAYGQDLLQGNSNAIYLHADAAQPSQVLEHPLTQQLIGSERRVGIVFLALAHLLPDDQLRQSWQTIYNWAAPDSYMIVSGPSDAWQREPDLLAINQMYARSNVYSYYRSSADWLDLILPWKLTEDGIVENTNWGMSNPDRSARQLGFSMMLHKPK